MGGVTEFCRDAKKGAAALRTKAAMKEAAELKKKTETEKKAVLQAIHKMQPGSLPNCDAIFKARDTDGDGLLTKADIEGPLKEYGLDDAQIEDELCSTCTMDYPTFQNKFCSPQRRYKNVNWTGNPDFNRQVTDDDFTDDYDNWKKCRHQEGDDDKIKNVSCD